MMEVSIRPMLAEEQKYTLTQSHQMNNVTGCFGRLCCDFGSSETGPNASRPDAEAVCNFDEMRVELDGTSDPHRMHDCMDNLRRGRSAVERYVKIHPDSIMDGNEPRRYAIRFDIGRFVYLLGRTLLKEDHNYYCNFYCWCFENPTFDRHLQNARQGIRFVTSDWKELFRIPDGGQIRIIRPDGRQSDEYCRYIDSYHFETGCQKDEVYHICQFAEMLERSGSTVIPLSSPLPQHSRNVLSGAGETAFSEPSSDSPWGKVQTWKTLCPGVFSVSTASHGGIVVDCAQAEQLFSSAALQCAFTENGCYCFEEDCASAVAIRELMDKGFFTAPVNKYYATGKYEQIINESVQRYYPEYWKAREKALTKKGQPVTVCPPIKKERERER